MMMDSETVFQIQTKTHSPLQCHHQYLLAIQDFTLMEMETVLIQLITLYQIKLAQLDTRMMDMEIVLHFMFQLFV